MLLLATSSADGHAKLAHPESPTRIEACVRSIERSAVLRHVTHTLPCSRPASVQQLALVHPERYIHAIRGTCSRLTEAMLVDDATYICPGSYDAVCESTGAVLFLVDELLAGGSLTLPPSGGQGAERPVGTRPTAGFALVRPPGHHVLPTRPMGFGVFNTVSVAVKHAQQVHGVEKVLVVDFDVHHGNGTMEVFYDDPSVLYVSTHQAGLWPYTGKARDAGTGRGLGATINVPLPGGSGDWALREAWRRAVGPAALRFRPEMILVSAGYDGHFLDPLASFQLQSPTYHWLCSQLLALSAECCPGRLLLVLEGGYHLASLQDAVLHSCHALVGLPPPDLDPATTPPVRGLPEEPRPRVSKVLEEVAAVHGLPVQGQVAAQVRHSDERAAH